MKSATRCRLACGCLLLPLLASAQETGTKRAESKWWAETGQSQAVPAEVAADTSQEAAAPQTPTVAAADVADAPVQARLAGPVSEKDFDCVEVKRFEVGSGFIASKQDARAATIPAEKLGSMQRAVAGQIPEKIRGYLSTLVAEGSPQCPDPARALVLSGRITDFKAGNQALRYWVGFGAGAQKFGVLVRATRKSDGALVGEGEVIDRKVGGWVGGQAEKGLEDFAEKVAGFLKESLRAK
jgi:hypothetical protein